MALNTTNAIRYNKNRGYDTPSTGIIQSRVGASTNGRFDNDTVRKLYDWQGSSNRMSPLVQDGMAGPASLGVMIAEARRSNLHTEAAYLTRYQHNLPDGGIPDPHQNPIKSFTRRPITRLALRPRIGNDGLYGWIMRGCFEINILFDAAVPDPKRYEYRQFIRGSAGITEGVFMGDHNTNWQPMGSEVPANHAFPMPGGLPRIFKEDCQIVNQKKERFGYRHHAAVFRPNGSEGLIDRYLPTQSNGHQYQCRDTFGLEYDRPSVIGTKVRVQLEYIGYVYDKLFKDMVVQRSWSYNLNEIIKW